MATAQVVSAKTALPVEDTTHHEESVKAQEAIITATTEEVAPTEVAEEAKEVAETVVASGEDVPKAEAEASKDEENIVAKDEEVLVEAETKEVKVEEPKEVVGVEKEEEPTLEKSTSTTTEEETTTPNYKVAPEPEPERVLVEEAKDKENTAEIPPVAPVKPEAPVEESAVEAPKEEVVVKEEEKAADDVEEKAGTEAPVEKTE
ncbi:hypothetical protein ACFX13_046560 [Malus domestica]|uniref:major latex allergen Hev b 5-like n=1 Tax=Malus domestica TaxID=3750 RepID=UPI000498D5B7|nr:uncharacterized protein LOC103411284 [Malus domestica]